MSDEKSVADSNTPESFKAKVEKPIPALFATIHFRSDGRPDGYTTEEIERLNMELNKPSEA